MNTSKTAFGLHETSRVIIPGFYFTTLLFFLLWSFRPGFLTNLADSIALTILFVFMTVVSGLTMYAKESTKRRRAFQENQPSLWLQNKARTMSKVQPLDDSDAQRLYFYILNNHVPPIFHEKIFFFGTFYHIMILMRRTCFWFAMLATAAVLSQLAMSVPLNEQQASIAFTLAVWVIYLLNVRYNKADRKMQENYQDQIFWLELNSDLVEQILRKRRTH